MIKRNSLKKMERSDNECNIKKEKTGKMKKERR